MHLISAQFLIWIFRACLFPSFLPFLLRDVSLISPESKNHRIRTLHSFTRVFSSTVAFLVVHLLLHSVPRFSIFAYARLRVVGEIINLYCVTWKYNFELVKGSWLRDIFTRCFLFYAHVHSTVHAVIAVYVQFNETVFAQLSM